MADPPFRFHVHSMPGAGEKSGCKEPGDDASVLDGEAERAILLGVAGVAPVPHSRNERASRSTLLDENQRPPAPHLDAPSPSSWTCAPSERSNFA
jgi:hypothetical protein